MQTVSSRVTKWRTIGLAAAICLLTIAAFSSSLSAGLVHWDDDINILDNPHIHKVDGQSLAWMFTDSSYTPRYRPLNWLSWALIYHFFGPNPFPYHALTLALHGINAALLFLVIVKLMRLGRNEPLSPRQHIYCGLATLFWALHPLRVEAVTWVNCQIYTQSFFFLLIALLLYFQAAKQERPIKTIHYWSSLLLFLCSLLTYPTAVAFVVVLLAIDFFPLKRLDLSKWFSAGNRTVILEKVPFAILTVLIGGIAVWARTNATAMWSEISDSARLNWLDQVAQAFYIWAYYLWKTLAAFDLSPVYTQLVEFRWTQWPFLLSVALIVAVSGGLLVRRRKHPVLLAVWVCYLALLVPMLGLTEHPHYPNDRYSYIVSTLFSVLIAAGLVYHAGSRYLRGIYVALIAAIIALTTLTVRQTRIWHDSYTLFDYVLLKLGNDPYRSDVLWRLGRAHAGEGRFDKAIEGYSEALKIQPRFTKAHIDLATVYVQTGRTNEALTHYRAALNVRPKDPLANYNLGVVLDKGGKIVEALDCYRTASASEPGNLDYCFALAGALHRMGKQAEGNEQLAVALKRHPNSPDAHCRMGSALAAQGQLAEAIEHFSKAIQLNPAHGEAHYHLGTALAMNGKVAEATPHFIESARLQPKVPQTHLACGMALAESGKFGDAAGSYRAALKLQPDLMPAIVNLGWLLSANRDPKVRNGQEAITLAETALKIAGEEYPEAFDLLAAAYAEAGKWKEAVGAAQRASSLATKAGRRDITADLERKIKLYESGQAFRM